MKIEDIEAMLKPKYHHNGEDIDAEEIYYDNNRTAIKEAIEEGRIDPEVLTSDIFARFISDGIDFFVYEEMEKEYCIQKGIEYNEYKKDREKIFEENTKKISEKKNKDLEL